MTKNDEERLTTRNNKLSFDEYTGKFYFESKIEGLERTCKNRLKQVEAMNKGESLILEGHHRQLEGKMHIFEMKSSRESDSLKESLRGISAHRSALEEVGRRQDQDPNRNEMLGRYGSDSSRRDLLPLINLEKLKMDPTWRRKKECEVLLSQRKQMEVIDRQQPTSRIMLKWTQKRPKGEGKDAKKDPARKQVTQLILPPIKVKITPRKTQAKSVADDKDVDKREDPETTSLPPVFVTQVQRPAPAQ